MILALRPPVRTIPRTARERYDNVLVRVTVVMRGRLKRRSWCSGDNARSGWSVRSRVPRCTSGGRRIAVGRRCILRQRRRSATNE
jgi:hypothetical protein